MRNPKAFYHCRVCGAKLKGRSLARHLERHRRAACKAIRSSMGSLRRGFAVNGVIEEPDVVEEIDALNVAIALIKNPLPFI